MKLISYAIGSHAGIGLVNGDGIVDLGSRLGVNSMRDLIASGRLSEAKKYVGTGKDHDIRSVSLLPVVTNPAHIYCVGVNYADHLAEAQSAGLPRPTPKQPSLFIRFAETMVGHGAPLVCPRVSTAFDYEAELAVIIGTGGRYIEERDALDHVAGYTCFNDGSIRDWQFHSSQVTSGKNFVGTGPLGPWMVTTDEIPDAGALDIKLMLNGRVMQHSNTKHLIFSIQRIISYASALVPLQPGDVIATGTPAGVGFARSPQEYMNEGDVCEVVIERIGTLRNVVTRELEPSR
jgi:2-keto-4-pentenoate hydratase/2-oxohepta-3-ene-1,7-dioic acid hydratase in catechol pathway